MGMSNTCAGSGHFAILGCWFGDAFEVDTVLVGRSAVGRVDEALGFAGARNLTEQGYSVRLMTLGWLASPRCGPGTSLAVEVRTIEILPLRLALHSLAGEDVCSAARAVAIAVPNVLPRAGHRIAPGPVILG